MLKSVERNELDNFEGTRYVFEVKRDSVGQLKMSTDNNTWSDSDNGWSW